MKASTLIVICASLTLLAEAQGQPVRGGIGGLGAAIDEIASKEMAMQREVEMARQKAAIELEYQRSLQQLRQSKPVAPKQIDPEIAKLEAIHPQWAKISTSNLFKSWLASRDKAFSATCSTTQLGDVLASCFDEFFNSTFTPARR